MPIRTAAERDALILATAHAAMALVESLNYLPQRPEWAALEALLVSIGEARAAVPPPVRPTFPTSTAPTEEP